MANKEEISRFLLQEFPQCTAVIDELTDGQAIVRQAVDNSALRPGGTVSGPTLMTLADLAVYVAVLSRIGIVPLAVTTNLNIHFLKKPAAGKDLVAKCRLIKCGRSIAVADVEIFSEGHEQPVAYASASYAIPPR